eukprot:NODE_3042_length_1041_cov_35.665208_g2900_i0.p1 GENE.NODE_3042_length_1041_cov_35.665208_g2900_i0~~NODE_3042_length_1041_cov_35.665208_g2900_i0.p1  ORF type:complete len:322 (+),score=66.68 NODE_3042_length_1041_cov_35.665208_g2900_i0:59-967(+)
MSQLNINFAVDKQHEGLPFSKLINLPPSGLQGLAARGDRILKHIGVTTIKELAQWRPFHIARAIVQLATKEEVGKRSETSTLQLPGVLTEEWRTATLTSLVDAPLSALNELVQWARPELHSLGLTTISQLAQWKYALWAEGITTLAEADKSPDAALKRPLAEAGEEQAKRQKVESAAPSKLSVKLIAATNLLAADPWGTSDPYVIVRLGNEKRQSKVVLKTLAPTWDERFDFSLAADHKTLLKFALWDSDLHSADDPLGESCFNLASLTQGKPTPITMPVTLYHQHGESSQHGQLKVELHLQ